MPCSRTAVADAKAGGRIANVEQPETAFAGKRGEPGFVAQPMVKPGRNVHPRLERSRRIVDQGLAKGSARISDAQHQRPRTCRRARLHVEARQPQA